MSEVDFTLLQKTVSEARDEARSTRNEVVSLRTEMREGFASLRSRDHATKTDIAMIERRLVDLELAVERISHAEGINTDQ